VQDRSRDLEDVEYVFVEMWKERKREGKKLEPFIRLISEILASKLGYIWLD